MSKIIYSGIKFREFLSRRGITYQEASAFLGIDKNTIGKAVRGGNLNMSVLLTICNMYHLNIADFFVLEHDGEENQTHENSINPILSDNKQVLSSVSKNSRNIKFLKNQNSNMKIFWHQKIRK